MADWHAAARYRERFPPEAVREMALAAIDMIDNPENEPSNRVSLIQGLMALSDVLDNHTIKRAFDQLELIARGDIDVSLERKSGLLDTVKITTKTKEDLRSIAIIGAARVGRREAELYRNRLEELLDDAFCAPEIEVRRGAFAAFREFPVRSEGPLLAVLLGTRDSDPACALTAFSALAEKEDLTLNRNHWRLLLYSTRLAGRSTSRELRQHAAFALARLIKRAPSDVIRREAEEILSSFGYDISASVRKAAQWRAS